METHKLREIKRVKRKKSIRKKINGTPQKPRLSVFRSLKHIYAQLIDDTKGQTIVSASSLEKEFNAEGEAKTKVEKAVLVGKLVGKRALDKQIERIVFDRNGFIYHGRLKAVSDGAREAGLKF